NLLTKRKSPIWRVCCIDPDGIRNASTRNVRRPSQMTSAKLIDLTQSRNQRPITWPRVRLRSVPLKSTQSFQSAMKRLVSRGVVPWRFDANTSLLPSGENIGNELKSSENVTRSSPVPSMFTMNSSKVRPPPWWLEEKMIRLPSGWKNGAKLAPPSEVTRRG